MRCELAQRRAARLLPRLRCVVECVDGRAHDRARFRCIKGFICQFGIGATPELNAQWKEKGSIVDDPHMLTNGGFLARGMLSFAGGGADSRTTQLFVSLRDSKYLGKAAWETPVGQIVEGMGVMDAWYKGYGDSSRHGGRAPEQSVLQHRGSEYVRTQFPDLDFIRSCSVVGTRAETGEQLASAHSRQLP